MYAYMYIMERKAVNSEAGPKYHHNRQLYSSTKKTYDHEMSR